MKLIVCSIGVLVVTGVISSVIAPVLSLAQPVDLLDFFASPGRMLTTEPNESLLQVDAQTRSTLQSVLTPIQRIQLETALGRDEGVGQTMLTALNLSPVQQTELMQILLSNQSPPADVLTPVQIEQVRRSLPFHP